MGRRGLAIVSLVKRVLRGKESTGKKKVKKPSVANLPNYAMQPMKPGQTSSMKAAAIKNYYALAQEYLTEYGVLSGRMLEIGGSVRGNAMKRFPQFQYNNLNLEPKGDIPTIVGDITDCKTIPDDSFDFIFSRYVFEHIAEPWKGAKEITRILRPRGIAMTVTVWAWRYHPAPIDYWRFSPDCLKFLFSELECLECNFSSTRRRSVQEGFWPNGADAVPADHYGGWLESWMVYHIGLKE